MIDQHFVDLVATQISVALPQLFVGRQHDSTEIELPAVLLSVEGEAVVGSRIYRGTLTAIVISSSDDSTSADHAARSFQVDSAIRETSGSSEFCTICGIVPKQTSPDVEGTLWKMRLEYTVGYAFAN